MKTTPSLSSQLFTPRSPLMRLMALLMMLVFIAWQLPSAQANTIVWSNTGASTAWYTNTNWTANTSSAQWLTSDVAQFNNAGTATTAGINMGTASLSIGAIEMTSARTRNLTIGNSSATTGTLTLNGTTVNSIADVIVRNASASNLTITNNETGSGKTMNLALGDATVNNVLIESSGNITIASNISGSSKKLGLVGAGTGTLTLSGTNTYSGGTLINGSGLVLSVTGDSQLGTAPGSAADNITIQAGRLEVTANTTIDANRNILLGAVANTPSLSTKGSSTVVIYNGTFKNLTGNAGTLVKQGSGTLSLGGQSTYTGATAINNGILQLTTGNDRLPTGTVVSIGQAASTNLGTLDLNGRNQQIAGLQSTTGTNAGASTNVVTSSTASTLTINNTSDYVYSDGTSANSGIISGGINLIKSGNGKQTLGGVNTYNGTTTISGGTLALGSTGSINNSTVITVGGGATYDVSAVSGYALASGQTIKGTGTVTGAMTIASGSTLSPGNSPGTLNTGAVTFAGGGNYNWQLLNTATGAGTGWDLLNVTGGLNITANSGSKFNLNLWTLSGTGPDVNGNALNFDNTQNYSWTIATASGGITGFDTAAFNINQSSNNGTSGFSNSLGGGTLSLAQSGNNLNLIFTAGSTALYWSGAGTGNPGTWSSTPSGTGTNGVWAQTNTGWDSAKTANFAGTAGAVTVTTVTANKGITFSTTGYSLTGGTVTLSSTGSNNVITTDTNVTATIASALSTSAGITKSGNGTLIFTTAQSYTGGTSVSAGTLQLGDGTSNNGSVAGDITNSSSVAFANPNDQTYGGAITGGGSVSKSGAGKLTLNGTSNYGGGTTITGGTLALGTTGDTLSDTGAVTINGGILDAGTVGDAVGLVTLTSGSITGSGGTLVASSYIVNNSSGTTTISGVTLDSTGGLTKSGAGSLTLSGTNTYLGGTQINGGSTSVSSDANLGDSAGVLGINGGSLALTGNFVAGRALTIGTSGGTIANGGNNFSNSAASTINGTLATTGSGDVALNGATTFGASGALNIGTGGSVTLGQSTGTINMGVGGTFDGNLIIGSTPRVNFNSGSFGGAGQIQVQTSLASITASGSSATGTIGNQINLNSTNAVGPFTTNIGATSGNTLILNGAITGNSDVNFATGAGGFIQNGGAGLVLLNAASTYTGNTTINNSTTGIIRLGITNALPTTTELTFGTVTGAGPGTLDLNGYDQTVAALSFGGQGTAANAKITNTATGNSVLTVNGSTTPANAFSGIIQNGGSGKTVSLVKDGSNTLELAGANTYTGGTTINGGTLKLGGSGNILADSGAVTLGGGTFDINGANEGVGAVTLNSGSIINSAVDQTKALTGSSYEVKSGTVSAVLGGSGITLTKNSDGSGPGGTVTLSGVNTYTGDTTVNAGKLIVSGSISSNTTVNTGASLVVNGTLSGNLTTASGSFLSGTGSVTGTTLIDGGIHNPGNSPGIQSFGDLTYNNATVNWDLANNTIAGRGTNYDGINVSGNLNFIGSNSLSLNFNGAGSLVSWVDTFWLSDHTWSVYDVTGTNNTFSNLSLGTIGSDSFGSLFGTGNTTGGSFALGLSGNNGVLNYTAGVPEPSRAVLMLFGAAGLLLRRRRKA